VAPNPDNVYLRATIDPSETYRVWSDDVTGMREGIFSLHEGDMQRGEYGVYSERTLGELERDGARLEIVVSPDEHPGNWMPTRPEARLFMLRVYVDDWSRDVVPTFHIERTSTGGSPSPPPPTPERIAAALDRSMHWLATSIPYWKVYLDDTFARGVPNHLAPARAVPGGADHLRYGSGVWELADDEVLLIACDVPDADYWGWTIHTAPWFESGDYANRQTSLSGRGLYVDDDHRVRLVLAHHDPGVPNWIDTEGRRRGLLVYRLVGARSGVEPAAEVVGADELRARLPPRHPVVTTDERRVALRARRASVARRGQ